MSETIVVALITGGLALLGTYISNSKSAALIAYRLQQLEEKVNRLMAVEKEKLNAEICDYVVEMDTPEQAADHICRSLNLTQIEPA